MLFCSAQITTFFEKLAATSHAIKCIVKPNESAGTDHVFLCSTLAEAVAAFHVISNQINGLGHINKGALAQEYLVGSEYVIDGVSRDGVYKIVAVWKYDKREVNGANFVYFGMTLCDCDTPEVRNMIEYARKVVAALKIYQGPTHMEVICHTAIRTDEAGDEVLTHDACLVEIGSRCHGGEGSWIPVAQECIGYTQLEVALNCYLRPDQFDALPAQPVLKSHGTEAFLVSYLEGTLKDIAGLDAVRELSSFR